MKLVSCNIKCTDMLSTLLCKSPWEKTLYTKSKTWKGIDYGIMHCAIQLVNFIIF